MTAAPEGAAPSAPEPDTDAAVDFLERWTTGGPWVLTAIGVDRSIETLTFREPERAREWIAQHNGRANLYFMVNPPTVDLRKKASREDVRELAWLHVDVDPRAGEDLEEERSRALALLTTRLPPRASLRPPS